MDLFDVLKTCARRWFVFIPLLVVTILIAYSNYSGVKPVYFGNVSVGLTAPSTKIQQSSSTAPVTVNSNGLVDAGGVSYLASLLSMAMNESGTKSTVREQGGTVGYNAKVFTQTTGVPVPILVISASGTSAVAVQRTLQLAVGQAEPVLQSVQGDAGVPNTSRYRALSPSEVPVPGGGFPSRTRQAVATILGGLLVSVVLTVAADAVIQYILRRRRLRGRKRDDRIDVAPDDVPRPTPSRS